MVFSIYSSLSRFNKKCSISQSTLRCGMTVWGTIKILVTGRANSEMENLENSQYWTQNLNSQNIQRINHFRTKSQYSPRSCRKFGGLRKIFLDHSQFLICFSNGLFKKWTNGPWIPAARTTGLPWYYRILLPLDFGRLPLQSKKNILPMTQNSRVIRHDSYLIR